MASKRRLRRRACESKQRHADQAAAEAHVRSLKRKDVRVTGLMIGAQINSYRCKFCGGWHVGRMSRSQIQSMSAKKGSR